ncbi:MAG: hypothetical protein CVT94_16750 [Bacteroidetes bacterium HGW-Bacteroidetes-11]|jgi:hypothetical protein|nr:MAG: hypothetical protein CVT94_16750 [Bacteroidetes bacterium HGW-Bacteroidetes-11]
MIKYQIIIKKQCKCLHGKNKIILKSKLFSGNKFTLNDVKMHFYASWLSGKIKMTFSNKLHFLSSSYPPFGPSTRLRHQGDDTSVFFRGLIEGDLTVVISNFASSEFCKSIAPVQARKSLKIHSTKDIDLRI